jgi:nitrite reductase (NADH) large subunit
MKRLVLVGNGMAGVHCIEEILRINQRDFEITIFGSEKYVNYNRILLSSVLQGSVGIDELSVHDRKWYEKHQIRLSTGETVVKIDTTRKLIRTDKNSEVPYDKLILATGSSPFMLPIAGVDKEGVMAFRTIDDCQKIIHNSKTYKKAVVIGGGVLGLEAAKGLLNLGMEVVVVHLESHLMDRQLDFDASRLLQKELEKQGMKFLLAKETQEIFGDSRVKGVLFKDGTRVETDLVIMAVGIRPNKQLALESGIETNRAILVNDYLQTNFPDTYAVGECAEHRGIVYGLVKPLYEQGKALASHICGIKEKGYRGSVLSTKLKIAGVDVFSIGQFTEDDRFKAVRVYDELDNVYKKLVFQDHKLVGAVLVRATKEAGSLEELIIKEKDVSDFEKVRLLQPRREDSCFVAELPLSEIICNCNHVSKGAIIDAVQSKGLTTVEEIRKCSKASSTCGGCHPLVANLLSYIKSDHFNEVIEVRTLCGCTELTEDEVVQHIQFQRLTSIEEVMTELNWQNKQGCTICQSALHYYLEMIYPQYRTKQSTKMITIKSCFSEDGCACNKQVSLKLAKQIEQLTEFLHMPNRIKIGISACIHNGADSTTKDIGLIRMQRGWEIYIGGSSGRDVRAGVLLCIAESEEEAVQIISGFIQYYRGTANFSERSWDWIERVGMVHIREVLFMEELRQQLVDQLNTETIHRKGVSLID